MATRSLRLVFAVWGLAAIAWLAPRAWAAPCVVPDAGGTADLPPAGCDYTAPTGDVMEILPPAVLAGSTIEMTPTLMDFININEIAGGTLLGDQQTYDATLKLAVTGTGGLAGFNRTLFVPMTIVTHSAPRTPGDAVQSFETVMFDFDGSVPFDPDFDTLSILGGTNNGYAGAGQTTLTRLGPVGSDFDVYSFFDIDYTIDFTGAPGSTLEGLGGRTSGSIRLQTESSIPEPATLGLAVIGLFGLGIKSRSYGSRRYLSRWR